MLLSEETICFLSRDMKGYADSNNKKIIVIYVKTIVHKDKQ